jgi:hypothetical protein
MRCQRNLLNDFRQRKQKTRSGSFSPISGLLHLSCFLSELRQSVKFGASAIRPRWSCRRDMLRAADGADVAEDLARLAAS